MPELIIETSSHYCILALIKEGKTLAHSTFLHQNGLSGTLLPSIDQLLRDRDLTPQDLTAIAIGIGPGSYTGTRVGVAVGKTLGFALTIPVHGFCSLLAFLPQQEGKVALITANRSKQFYLVQCTLSAESISIEDSGLVSETALLELVEGVSTVCSNTPGDLPAELKIRSILPFAPNTTALGCYLKDHATPLRPEDGLIYLHEPVEKISPIQ